MRVQRHDRHNGRTRLPLPQLTLQPLRSLKRKDHLFTTVALESRRHSALEEYALHRQDRATALGAAL